MDGISQFPLKTFNSGSYYDKTKVPILFIQQALFLPKFLSWSFYEVDTFVYLIG